MNLKTMRAFKIKEQFKLIYEAEDSATFECLLKKWYFWATHSRLTPIIQAAKTIKNHWDGMLNWYQSKINNGILEGLNSVIQAAKSRAIGFTTRRNFVIIAYLVTGKIDFNEINEHVNLPTQI